MRYRITIDPIPDTCGDCPVRIGTYCRAGHGRYITTCDIERRPDNCPLTRQCLNDGQCDVLETLPYMDDLI